MGSAVNQFEIEPPKPQQFEVEPPEPKKRPGFFSALGSDLKSMVTHYPSGVSPYPGMDIEAKQDIAQGSAERTRQRGKEGYSPIYRGVAPLAEGLGVNVGGMEESAKEGDSAGILGHAATIPTVMAVGEGLARVIPKVAAKATAAVRSPVGRASTAAVRASLKKLPTAAIRRIPYAGDVAADVAQAGTRAYQRSKIPPVYPGAPLPEAPGVFPGASLPEAPAPEVLQARALETGGAAPAEEPSASLGRIPTPKAEAAAPASSAAAEPIPAKIPTSSRSALYKKLDQPLRESVGASPPPARGVSLRNQPKAASPVETVPEGHTPAESTAIRSYKYDPASKELHIADKTGKTYVYGEITPEQAEAFQNASSKGTAWQQIRNSSARVANIDKDGIRTPYKPPTSLRSAGPESEAPSSGPLKQKVNNLSDFIRPGRSAETPATIAKPPTAKPRTVRGVKVAQESAAGGEGDLTSLLQKSVDQVKASKGGVSTSADPDLLLKRWGADEESIIRGREQTRGMSRSAVEAEINQLTEAYKGGREIDPVMENRDTGNRLGDVDGRLRALAAKKAGLKRIPIIVRRPQ